MEAKITMAILILAIATAAPPCAAALDKSPAGVESWFQRLSTATANPKTTKLNFFLHDIMIGPHRTTVPINLNLTRLPNHFGRVMVMDSPLTVGPDRDSRVIGRCEGIFTFASQQEVAVSLNLNFVFTDGKYSGSTLSVLGTKRKSDRYREYPIVGGSGVFRLAGGVAVDQIYKGSVDPKAQPPTQIQVIVRHYDVDVGAKFGLEII